ncbi:MAG: hypothetical protein HOC71_10625 [Candidatus Latescibacteria bacterium]|nr:hypothetical protein [Candidatus Latescibacterota bacterium]
MGAHFLKKFFLIQIIVFITGIYSIHANNDWSDWKYRMPIKLASRNPQTSGLITVDATFSIFADRCKKPEKEIRLTLKTENGEVEIPFQLSRLSKWTKDTDGEKSMATLNGMITFFDEARGKGDAEYYLLYGNPDAQAPSYPTDIRVSGTGPAWTIENSAMTVILHSSGQVASVKLKAKPDVPIAPQRGVMHWNPGIFIPTRYWAHSFAWDPPEVCEIEQGPLYVEIRRSGIFPGIPEVHLEITYRIFSKRTFIESGTVMNIRKDIGVVALRNDELIFEKGFFTHMGWDDNGMPVKARLDTYKPVNRHGDILRISDNAAFITLYNPAKGVGAASVRVDYSNIGPNGAPPTLFDNATYVSNGELQYWFRPLIYFHVGWSRKQLITVPEGSIYSERNLYYFYETDIETSIERVVHLSHAARNKPHVQTGEYKLPPAK